MYLACPHKCQDINKITATVLRNGSQAQARQIEIAKTMMKFCIRFGIGGVFDFLKEPDFFSGLFLSCLGTTTNGNSDLTSSNEQIVRVQTPSGAKRYNVNAEESLESLKLKVPV